MIEGAATSETYGVKNNAECLELLNQVDSRRAHQQGEAVIRALPPCPTSTASTATTATRSAMSTRSKSLDQQIPRLHARDGKRRHALHRL
jgi:hypothetical protein